MTGCSPTPNGTEQQHRGSNAEATAAPSLAGEIAATFPELARKFAETSAFEKTRWSWTDRDASCAGAHSSGFGYRDDQGPASNRFLLHVLLPEKANEGTLVVAQGISLKVKPHAALAVGGSLEDGRLVYRGIYRDTDTLHSVTSSRSEEFLLLRSEQAPRRFEYDMEFDERQVRPIFEHGRVRFERDAKNGLVLEAPWVVDASGHHHDNAAHWEAVATLPNGGMRMALSIDTAGLRFPIAIDPSFSVSFDAAKRSKRLVAGLGHTCVILGDRTVRCWGDNTHGEVGNGASGSDILLPDAGSVVQDGSGALTGATALAAGGHHTCALLTAGTVKCWGNNLNGELGNETMGVSQTTAGFVKNSGANLSGVVAITAGEDHTCALMNDGTVKCWGKDSSGELGNGNASSANVRGATSFVKNGGNNLSGVLDIAASASSHHTCALLNDNTVKCWGNNSSGQLGIGTQVNQTDAASLVTVTGGATLANVASIAAGEAFSCANRTDGTVWCWGNNYTGQLGNGSSGASNVVLRAAAVSNLQETLGLGLGSEHACAVVNSGEVLCWGHGENGQLGDGGELVMASAVLYDTPMKVRDLPSDGVSPPSFLNGAVSVAAGAEYTCALRTSGEVRCWGDNAHGQLGLGDNNNPSAAEDASIVVVDGAGTRLLLAAFAGSEDCSNQGTDDDSDTVANELTDGEIAGASCTAAAQGICVNGSKACSDTTISGTVICVPASPGTESCANTGTDDDCDGNANELENGVTGATPCTVGVGGCQATGTRICVSGSLGCSVSPLCTPATCATNEYVSNHACTPCAAGSTRAAGDDNTGSDTSCTATLCSANQYVSNHVCTVCAAGSTRSAGDNATAGNTACTATLCSANQFVSNHACVACPNGTTRAAGDNATGADTTCGATLCAANQHVSNHTCVACAAGSTRAAGDDASGSDTACAATLCAANQRVSIHACVACAPGTTRAAGDDASGGDTNCAAAICAANQHVANHVCVACSAGSTRAAGDDASAGDTSCAATLCAINQHVSSHACIACPAGSTKAAGDDASGADTLCGATVCAANEHVSNHGCQACAQGSTRAAGDDATGSDTTCASTMCASNQRVSSHTCVACATGSTRAAGDNATGSDTSCAATACAANQHVVNHVCVACAGGTARAAGDLATGSDTTCSDVDECLVSNGGCSSDATCTNTSGSRTCACKTGFTGDGVTCTDTNECATSNGGCDSLTTCTNTPGSRTCGACPVGYSGSGETHCDLTCPAGEIVCGSVCVNPKTDNLHCGQCSNPCTSSGNTTSTCVNGTCTTQVTCASGYGDCNPNVAGCETSLDTVDNCDACGATCVVAANAIGRQCIKGACAPTECVTDFDNCDHDATNGCEANLKNDAQNCGACGTVCSTGTCANGVCSQSVTCAAGSGDCNNASADGCETDLRTCDNCGACGVACADVLHGTAQCSASSGTCEITCETGFHWSGGACVGCAGSVDDGNACTVDSCDVGGNPTHHQLTDAELDDNNPCTVDRCSAFVGITHAPANVGTACGPNSTCNANGDCVTSQAVTNNASSEQEIGQAGRVHLVIPEGTSGTLSTGGGSPQPVTNISVIYTNDPPPSVAISDVAKATDKIELEPSGAQFTTPLRLSLFYNPRQAMTPFVRVCDDTGAVCETRSDRIITRVSDELATVTVELSHFSIAFLVYDLETSPGPDAGVDAASDSAIDAAIDGAIDAAIDAAVDAEADATAPHMEWTNIAPRSACTSPSGCIDAGSPTRTPATPPAVTPDQDEAGNSGFYVAGGGCSVTRTKADNSLLILIAIGSVGALALRRSRRSGALFR